MSRVNPYLAYAGIVAMSENTQFFLMSMELDNCQRKSIGAGGERERERGSARLTDLIPFTVERDSIPYTDGFNINCSSSCMLLFLLHLVHTF